MMRILGLGVLLVGCKDKLTEVTDFEIVVSDAVVTVATASWSTDSTDPLVLEFGETEDFGMEAPATTDTTLPVLGLRAETTYYARLRTTGEEPQYSETLNFTTGLLPNVLPTLSLVGEADDDFYMAVPVLTDGQAWPAIIDSSGSYVWYHIDESGLDVYRTRLSYDGQSVLYNAGSVSGDPSDASKLFRVSLDGNTVEEIPVPLLAHDFVELPDGTIAAMVTEYRDVTIDDETVSFRGDQIVEVAPDGTQTVAWSAWDCFDPTTETGENLDLSDDVHDWTFGNAIDYDPVEDVYYQGMRNFSSIARIDRQTGSCDWVFGTHGATIEPDNSSDIFQHQHQFEVLEDSFLVFDNDGSTNPTSRVLEYRLDPDSGTAEQIWSYVPDPNLYTFVLGDVNRFDDGDTLITWSVLGQIDRVSDSGSVGWTLNTSIGYIFGLNNVTSTMFVAE
jgi:hypothetical protein